MDYIKKEELGKLMSERSTATSHVLPDVSMQTGQGLSVESISTGQAKYNAVFQMASRRL